MGRARIGLVWLLIFVAAALCLYAPALRLGLLSDDYVLRAMARTSALGAGSGWFFRPVPLVVWRLVLAVGDFSLPLHAINIVLHGVNAFLVAVLGCRLGMGRSAALGGATLFLTFPAAPEAVAWASGIQDVLMTTMALGAVIAGSDERLGGWRTPGALGMCALGLGSKETAICIPVLIVICWVAPQRMHHLRPWRLYAWLAAVVSGYGVVRVSMGIRAGYLITPSRYFLKQLITNAFATLSAPWRTPTSTVERWVACITVVTLALLLTHALLVWQRHDPTLHRAARLAAWVIASVAPVFTYFYVSPTLEGSRYLYLAECGWALLVADLIRTTTDRFRWKSATLTCGVGAAVVMSAALLEHELGIWRDAADLRDRVLVQAHESIVRSRCAVTRFVDLPDSMNGAYVFRNGFQEALGSPVEPPSSTVSAECSWTWRGDSFVPTTTRK
jgi:hypothetical protein